MSLDSVENRQIFETGRLGHDLTLEDIERKAITVKCSACSAPLCEIWITRPQSKVKHKITINCAHCGDKAFPVVVEGDIHMGVTEFTNLGGYEQVNLDDPEFINVVCDTMILKEWKQ